MKLKLKIIFALVLTIALYSGCAFQNEPSSPDSGGNAVAAEKNVFPLSVTYIGYGEHYRFVSASAPILWMPQDDGPSVCDLTDTLVEVMFAGYTGEDDVWLFVSFKTYDTPTNNRGWIHESKTEKYTKENREKVRDIIIPKGTQGADSYRDTAEDYDRYGYIEKRQDGKVLVMFAGGEEVWYQEKDIEYPPLE